MDEQGVSPETLAAQGLGEADHGDVLAGAMLAARRDPFWERIRSWRRNAGAMPGPFEAWLLQRGLRTLFLRVHRASQTAHEPRARLRRRAHPRRPGRPGEHFDVGHCTFRLEPASSPPGS